MANGRMPLLLTFSAAALLAAVLLVVQPYTATWPGRLYATAARDYVRAALRQDSLELTRRSVSPTPVIWALLAARSDSGLLARWSRRASAWTGESRGDTTEVFFYPWTDYAWTGSCGEQPLIFEFVGSGDNARVAAAGSSCFDSGPATPE